MKRPAKKVKRQAGQGGWEPLIELLRKFRDDRDWKQFHNPKDLAAAIAIEAGELQEHFLWKSKDEVAADLVAPAKRQEVVHELADILIYAPPAGRLPRRGYRRGSPGQDGGQRPEVSRQQGPRHGPEIHGTGVMRPPCSAPVRWGYGRKHRFRDLYGRPKNLLARTGGCR